MDSHFTFSQFFSVSVDLFLSVLSIILSFSYPCPPPDKVSLCFVPGDVIFDLDEFRLGKVESVTLRAFGHTIWGLCIAWIIFASETGHGGMS